MGPMGRVMLLMGILAGCAAYEPPGLDRSRTTYQIDLTECQENEPTAVDDYNAKVAPRWFISPFRRPFQVRAAIRKCMVGKGYADAG